MSKKLEGKVAVITGGNSGIGLATARQLHGDGAAVVIVDLPSSNGAEIASELGERAVFAPADVTDEAAVSAALDEAEKLGHKWPVRYPIK